MRQVQLQGGLQGFDAGLQHAEGAQQLGLEGCQHLRDALVELGSEADIDVTALAARKLLGLSRLFAHSCLDLVDAPRMVRHQFLVVRALPLQSVNGSLQLADGLLDCVVRLGASRSWRQASARMGRAAARVRGTVARSVPASTRLLVARRRRRHQTESGALTLASRPARMRPIGRPSARQPAASSGVGPSPQDTLSAYFLNFL